MRKNMFEMMMVSVGAVANEELLKKDSEKAEKIASSTFNTGFEKTASIFIDNPSLENIEQFVMKYTLNELAGLTKTRKVDVSVVPEDFSESNPNNVSSASGIASIKVGEKAVELPFIIRRGELVPFDVIQFDGQRVPFSRENLKKLILMLENSPQQEDEGIESPYSGVSDRTSAATVHGFMGDALAIRDSNSMRRGAGHYVVACEEYEGFDK